MPDHARGSAPRTQEVVQALAADLHTYVEVVTGPAVGRCYVCDLGPNSAIHRKSKVVR